LSAKETFLRRIPQLSEAQAQAALDAVADLGRAESLLEQLRRDHPRQEEGELLDRLAAEDVEEGTIEFLRERLSDNRRGKGTR
jgi:hypothetical protein